MENIEIAKTCVAGSPRSEPRQEARPQALKQESVPNLGSSDDVSVDSGARKRLLTKLPVHDGLLVANMVEDHHEGVLHAACGR